MKKGAKQVKKEDKKTNAIPMEEKYPKGRNSGDGVAVPGINTPGIELPAFNPPVPNRAWTAMKEELELKSLSEGEKRDLYFGRDTNV